MSTRIYYDTEFIEDGRTIDLISIGMITDDGREFYAVNEAIGTDPLRERICEHQWLMENVIPGLPLRKSNGHGKLSSSARFKGYFHLDLSDNTIMPLRMIRNHVRDFILAAGPDIELWAWYGAYDHVALAQMFGPMIRLPKGIPMWTNDLRQEAERLGNPELPEQADGVHNALADARHNLVRARRLAEIGGGWAPTEPFHLAASRGNVHRLIRADALVVEEMAHAADPKAFEDHPIERRSIVAELQWAARRKMATDHAKAICAAILGEEAKTDA